MNHSWNAPLKGDQRSNPVVEKYLMPLDESVPEPSDSELSAVFTSPKQSLKTWGRPDSEARTSPHWIGVHRGTNLHTDPAYPRYTHQLLLRIDDYVLRGLDKVETPLTRGLYYVVDTHSPHQLLARSKEARWFLAVSLDSKVVLEPSVAMPMLLAYARSAELLTPDILVPNNGGRFAKKLAKTA